MLLQRTKLQVVKEQQIKRAELKGVLERRSGLLWEVGTSCGVGRC